jgi:hypothetical protein
LSFYTGIKPSQLKETVIEKTQRLLAGTIFASTDELLQQLPSKDAMSLEDVFIAVYCNVSNFIANLGGQRCLRHSHNNDPEFTDAEVMTIELVRHLAEQNSQNAWLRHVRKN